MDLKTLRSNYHDQIFEIANLCCVDNIRVFGSVARGEETERSDIDFLIHAKPMLGFVLVAFSGCLEEFLKCKVDVIPDSNLHLLLKEQILKEAIEL